jgi:deoxyribodipyrimidine photo-lyase
MTKAIWWVRRDLRLNDNQALTAALANAEHVIPVFVLDPVLLDSPDAGEKRVTFLFGGLRKLDADLRARGSRLIVRRGEPQAQLKALLSETGVTDIFAEEDFAPYALRRDTCVAEALPLHLTGGVTVRPPGTVLKTDRAPYTVFTPFSRAWKAFPLPSERDVLVAPKSLPPVPDLPNLATCEIPDSPYTGPFPASEAEAQHCLNAFVDGSDAPVYRYSERRDRLDQDGTSKLSAYLRFGMVSARQAMVGALNSADSASSAQERKGAETWINELIWREFYIHILNHFPHVCGSSFRPKYDRIAWENDESVFAAWCEGQTGYPVVDAAMRQLSQTGWMHNRARMIVASFLVKDLLIDWRWGERFFMQHLVDGDPAANNGGWQWTAGTGTDAAPYFRIFNPVLQGKKHDPDGVFVRHWLPELVDVPGTYIHSPWEMPEEVQRKSGCIIGGEYPIPIIDHSWARERTLAAYARAREISQ